MSKIDVENTILTALRVAPASLERRVEEAQGHPLARDAWKQSATKARKALERLEAGTLRVEQGSQSDMDPQSRALFVVVLREAHSIYHQHANDEQLPERLRAQFELQAAEARVVCSRLELGRLHIVAPFQVIDGSKE